MLWPADLYNTSSQLCDGLSKLGLTTLCNMHFEDPCFGIFGNGKEEGLDEPSS